MTNAQRLISLTCYFSSITVIKLTYGEGPAFRLVARRAPDHGRAVQARPGDCRRGHGRFARRSQLLHRSHAASGARTERARGASGGRTSLRVCAGGPETVSAEIGAQAPGGDILRRLGGAGRGGGSRR